MNTETEQQNAELAAQTEGIDPLDYTYKPGVNVEVSPELFTALVQFAKEVREEGTEFRFKNIKEGGAAFHNQEPEVAFTPLSFSANKILGFLYDAHEYNIAIGRATLPEAPKVELIK